MSLEFGFHFVNQHRGSYATHLARYETAAADARGGSPQAYRDFCSNLPTFASDERNLMTALIHLLNYGGIAPGPDGEKLPDLCRIAKWALVRELRDRLRRGRYARGALRRCLIEKRPRSSGKRTIWVANLEDRVVARAVAQILEPLLEPFVDPLTFNWRRRGTQAALAYAVQQVTTANRTLWIIEDLRNAFDEVPRCRLFQILRHYLPNDELCCLIENLAAHPSRPRRGILQGSPLSPPLLDIYLSHLLHRRWRRDDARPPLLRYVDDMWIGCRTGDDAAALYRELNVCIRAAGMRPKLGAEAAIVDLRDRAVTWLGYHLRLVRGQLIIRSAVFAPTSRERIQQKHEALVAKFARLYERPVGWRRANSVVRGIVAYLAPTLPFEDPQRIYQRIAKAASEAGFDEISSFDEVLAYWTAAHDRWVARLDLPAHL